MIERFCTRGLSLIYAVSLSLSPICSFFLRTVYPVPPSCAPSRPPFASSSPSSLPPSPSPPLAILPYRVFLLYPLLLNPHPFCPPSSVRALSPPLAPHLLLHPPHPPHTHRHHPSPLTSFLVLLLLPPLSLLCPSSLLLTLRSFLPFFFFVFASFFVGRLFVQLFFCWLHFVLSRDVNLSF